MIPTGSYPWKYQLLINEEGRSIGTVSAERVRLVNIFPQQNPFLLALLVTGKGNGGHHLYAIKADTMENVYEGYYDYAIKTYDRHMDMAVFNPSELNIRFADNNHDGFNDIIFTGEKLMLGGFSKDSLWYDVLIKDGKEFHYSPESPAARIPIKFIFLYDQKTGHFKAKEPYQD